jgi:hypothetical protein
MSLNWPMAARAADVLVRHGLHGLHPVAVAAASTRVRGAEALVPRAVRDARYPLACDHLDEDTRACVDWFSARVLERLEDVVGAGGIVVPAYENGGDSGEEDELYCPRCLATYSGSPGECSDCPGVKLERRMTEWKSSATV